MDSFSSLFKALGGVDEVARKLKVTSYAVQKMAQRKSVRPTYWAPLIEMANARHIPGITLDKLARLATEQKVA